MSEELSQEELDRFTRESVDPQPINLVVRRFDNVGLSDSELRRRILERNQKGKLTYLLRLEYQRRLDLLSDSLSE